MAHDLVLSTRKQILPHCDQRQEVVLANGKPEEAKKVWNTMKANRVTISRAMCSIIPRF